jgi:hypothetical protein
MQSAQVSEVGIDRVSSGNDIKSTQTVGSTIKSGKLVSDSAAALPEPNNN